jgi:hypothetical protein
VGRGSLGSRTQACPGGGMDCSAWPSSTAGSSETIGTRAPPPCSSWIHCGTGTHPALRWPSLTSSAGSRRAELLVRRLVRAAAGPYPAALPAPTLEAARQPGGVGGSRGGGWPPTAAAVNTKLTGFLFTAHHRLDSRPSPPFFPSHVPAAHPSCVPVTARTTPLPQPAPT